MDKRPIDTTRRGTVLRLALYVVAIAALCAPMYVCAQAVGNAPNTPTTVTVKKAGDAATVTWSAPTAYSDGSALGAANITYTVYSAAPGAPWKIAAAAVSVLSWTSTPLTKGAQCYTVTDSVLALESGPAAAVCISVGVAANPPGAIGVR